jgi:hypothetical protein
MTEVYLNLIECSEMSVFRTCMYGPIKIAYETTLIVLRCPIVPETILQMWVPELSPPVKLKNRHNDLHCFLCEVDPHPTPKQNKKKIK